MTKETFVSAIEAIEKQYKHDLECGELLTKIYPEAHGYMLSYDNHLLTNALVSVLSEAMQDANNWIEYYMYELDFGKENDRLKAFEKDGAEIPLSTASDLYDLLNKK
jgi:hypothetical protein